MLCTLAFFTPSTCTGAYRSADASSSANVNTALTVSSQTYLKEAQPLVEACCEQQLSIGVELHGLDNSVVGLLLICILDTSRFQQPSGQHMPASQQTPSAPLQFLQALVPAGTQKSASKRHLP